MYYVTCAALPFIVALYRYATSHGHHGRSRADAWRDAKWAFGWTAVVAVLFAVAYTMDKSDAG